MMWNDRLRWRWLGIAVFSFCHLLCFSEVKAETIATVAGNGEPTFFGDWDDAVVASLFNPSDIFVDGDGTLYIAEGALADCYGFEGKGMVLAYRWKTRANVPLYRAHRKAII